MPSDKSASVSKIQRQAAEWLALHQARELSPSERAAFAEWCGADIQHQRAFDEAEITLRLVGELRKFTNEAEVQPNQTLVEPARQVRAWGPKIAWMGLATAAVVAIGFFWRTPPHPIEQVPLANSNTAVASRIDALPDGSEVELRGDALVEQHFTSEKRQVRLVHGEAHFTVAKNSKWPFEVQVEGIDVGAVGTAFDVRLEPKGVTVLVTEGKVKVTPSPGAEENGHSKTDLPLTYITAGQRSLVPTAWGTAASTPLVVQSVTLREMDRALSWQSGRLVFDSIPLSDAVNRFNRHLAARPGAPRLVVGDDRAGAVLVSGRVRADNPESFVEALETGFDIKVDRRSAGEIVLRKVN